MVDVGFIDRYNPTYGDNRIYTFSVGSLKWEGHDFPDKIREKTVWSRTKNKIKESALPMILEIIKSVATNLINDQIKNAF